MKPTSLKITQTGSGNWALTDDSKPIGTYGSVGLAMIAAHERAMRGLPTDHPERKKYQIEINRLKRGE